MGGPEFIIAIVAIACLTSLIKTWLDKKDEGGIDKETFNRLAKAFMEHKKEMQERVQNLETIVAEQDESNYSHIEASNDRNLKNDLQNNDNKSKVRS